MKILALLVALLGLWHPHASAAGRHDEAIAAYRKLAPTDIEKHPLASLPKGTVEERIDVSPKFRSASFGHTTTVVLMQGDDSFYVEYGKSTNNPASLYGPFSIH